MAKLKNIEKLDPEKYKYKTVMNIDNIEYVSKKNKKNKFEWVKVIGYLDCNTPEKYFSQFGHKIKYKFPKKEIILLEKELRKNNIFFYQIGWDNVWFYVDYAWSDVEELVKKEKYIKTLNITKNKKVDMLKLFDNVSFLFYSEFRKYWSQVDGKLEFQHNIIKKDKEKVIEIFTKIFYQKFSWNGSAKKTILVKLEKI